MENNRRIIEPGDKVAENNKNNVDEEYKSKYERESCGNNEISKEDLLNFEQQLDKSIVYLEEGIKSGMCELKSIKNY